LDHKFKEFMPLEREIREKEESSEDEEGESFDDFLYRKAREFNQQTREHPEDIKGWIAFVNFQEIHEFRKETNESSNYRKKDFHL